MTMFNRVVSTSVLIAGLLTSACGDDKGDGTSVSNSTKLAALTDPQARTLCRDWEKKYKDGLPPERAYCTAFAGDADLGSDVCEANLQQCLDDGDYAAEQADDWECDAARAAELSGEEPCTATVGEWRTCVDAQLKRFRTLVSRASCDDLSTFAGAWEHPKECEVIFDKCPDADI